MPKVVQRGAPLGVTIIYTGSLLGGPGACMLVLSRSWGDTDATGLWVTVWIVS